MKMKVRDYMIMVIIAATIAVVVTRNVDASEQGRGPSVDVNQSNDMNNQTAGDINLSAGVEASLSGGDMIGGDTTLAMDSKSIVVAAPGLGDVDIAACLGSTQWSLLVGGKQKLVLNQVCMAEFYLKQGRYDLAAQSLCNQPEIVAEYANESKCEAAHNFSPPPTGSVTLTNGEYDELMAQAAQKEEIEEYVEQSEYRYEQQQHLIEVMEVEHAKDDAEIAALKRTVKSEVAEADARRAAVRAKLAEKKEEESDGSEGSNN